MTRSSQFCLSVLVMVFAVVAVLSGCSTGSPDDAAEDVEARSTAVPTATRVPAPEQPAEDAPTAEPPTFAPPTPAPTAAPTDLFDGAGPYSVGVRTVSLSDREVEVWYPVQPIEVQGADTEIFDSLSVFPEALKALIPPELGGETDTGAFRDAVAADGEFPVLIYGHGFGGYRQVATNHTAHVASWGYVVVSVDHLERGLQEQSLDIIGAGLFDETNTRPNPDVQDVRDTIALLDAMTADASDPLFERIDTANIAITGHSAGAWAAVRAAAAEPDRIATWISVAGGAGDTPPTQPGIVVIAELDQVVLPARSYELFDTVTNRALLVDIAGAGHNSFTDSCQGIRDLGGLSALVDLLGEAQVARADDGCTAAFLEPATAQALLNHLTVAQLRSVFGQTMTSESLDEDVLRGIADLADYQVGPSR